MTPELDIEFDLQSTIPVWRQLRDAIVDKAACGDLPAEFRLPPVRQFADDLDLAPGTVAKVYKDLEALGVIETRGRQGTFVSAEARQARDEAERTEILMAGARELAKAARQVGASQREVRAALAEALDE